MTGFRRQLRVAECKVVSAMAVALAAPALAQSPSPADVAAMQRTFISNLKRACDRTAKSGLTLVLEPINHRDIPGYFTNTTDPNLPASKLSVGDVELGDVDYDGDLDIITLFAQGLEKLILFTNNGKGEFTQKALLELNQLMGRRADTPLSVIRPEVVFGELSDLPALLTVAPRGHSLQPTTPTNRENTKSVSLPADKIGRAHV